MVKPVRRVVAGNDDRGVAVALSDGSCPDVRLDPARPGFAATRLWVTDSTPARVKGVRETLDRPHTLEPPRNGSVCRVVEFPPEDGYLKKIGAAEVAAYFAAMGSPAASTGGAGAPHPYMQRTPTLDFCYVLEGAITLVLDTEEVHLKEGDTVVQRGTNHAWSNRSDKPCRVLFSSHDGAM
jgi:mannose-6-phosphate isomerase-like protein (cupin superfamily)